MFGRKWLKDYFSYTRKERIGALAAVAAITGTVLLPRLFSSVPPPLSLKEDSVLLLALDTLQKRETASREDSGSGQNIAHYRYEPTDARGYTNGDLFPFDPNAATFPEWRRLGLNERTSRTILKYVNKGGRFYRPEDLQKIWGMPEGFYERVKGYVSIPSRKGPYPGYDNKPFIREERKLSVVDINEADTSAFIALPGIGSKLSGRIVNFREKLGGFYSVEQVGETWGLPDSTFQKLKPRFQLTEANLRKLNLNTASKDELKAHPYIRWNLANAIVEYRTQHGPFKNLEELKNVVLVDEATFGKIVPYLSL